MIVPMQKLTVLCLAGDRERSLEALRDLGVLHLVHIKRPEGEDLDQARARLTHLRRALEVLPKNKQVKATGQAGAQVVEDVWRLIQQRKDLEEKLELLRHERQRLAPFGDFDPAAIRKLAERGIHVRLYQAGPRQAVAAPEGTVLTELFRDKSGVFFVVAGRGDFKVEAQEVRLPEIATAEIARRIEAAEAGLRQVDEQLTAHAGDYGVVSGMVDEAQEQVRFLEARAGMGAAASVVYLQGFCPVDAVAAVRQAAARNGWGLMVQEPEATDTVPTCLRNAKWVDPIKPLLEFIGIVPGYNEVDLSVPILFFFSLFFAMLVGDAGYGVLFLAFSLWGRKKYPQAPREIFQFLNVMSICTIIWGVLTGNYFGIGSAGDPAKPTLLPPLVTWLTNPDNVKFLCFAIGVTQLSVAHIWNIVRMRKSLQALAQFGWLCTTWTMFFFACSMVLNRFPLQGHVAEISLLGNPFPKFMGPVFGLGVVLIVLFMTPLKNLKAEWFNHAMLPLNLVSNFVDVVSYIRLFAVGTASYAVASSFNEMLSPMLGHWLSGLFAAVFLFLAHALNIVLSIMGVMVHGVRLNTLEFSSHIGMQWTGVQYEPFRRTAKAGPAVQSKE